MTFDGELEKETLYSFVHRISDFQFDDQYNIFGNNNSEDEKTAFVLMTFCLQHYVLNFLCVHFFVYKYFSIYVFMKNFLQNFFLCIHSFEENVLNPIIINNKNSGEEICPK